MNKLTEAPIGEKIWIAAHRGRFGGCIPENTLDAFELAIRSGADIVETDVAKLADGTFVLFHDSSPERMLGIQGNMRDFTYEQIKDLQLRNAIGGPSGRTVNTLDEFLRYMKGKCLINLDKCADYLDEVYEKVLEYDMEEQILLKNPVPCQKDIAWLKKSGYRPTYIPVVGSDRDVEGLYQVLGEIPVQIVEIFIHSEQDYLISEEFIANMHARGIKLWMNALCLGKDNNLCADRGDDSSLLQSPEEGWGFMVQKGMDIIQTDWPVELGRYLSEIGKR